MYRALDTYDVISSTGMIRNIENIIKCVWQNGEQVECLEVIVESNQTVKTAVIILRIFCL